MAFDTNCRVDPVPFAILKILTNTDASGSGLGWVVCKSQLMTPKPDEALKRNPTAVRRVFAIIFEGGTRGKSICNTWVSSSFNWALSGTMPAQQPPLGNAMLQIRLGGDRRQGIRAPCAER